MFSWDWLWVVGELGVTYGCYVFWKKNDKYAAALEISPHIDIDNLKNFSSKTAFVDYATVHGLVQPNDLKAHSRLTSNFTADCIGVIHRLTLHEQKLEKLQSSWAETKKLISAATRYVPFRLVTSKGNYVHIDNPLQFKSIEDQLDVTHVRFDPNPSSSVQKVFETLLGNLSKGVETREEMLLNNTQLTGIGRLEKRLNVWHLVPHEQWGGILTRSTRDEILASFRSRSSWGRIFTILFGSLTGGTIIYLIFKYYSRKARTSNNSRPRVRPLATQDANTNDTTRLQCVICLDHEIVYSLQPCSHLALCQSCAEQLQRRDRLEQKCPICRASIEQYQHRLMISRCRSILSQHLRSSSVFYRQFLTNVNSVKDLNSSSKDYDALVVVATELDQIKDHVDHSVIKDLQAFRQLNKKFDKDVTVTVNDVVPGKRLIYSSTGKITRDFDDVRRFADAAAAGMKKALALGAKCPLIASFGSKLYQQAHLVTLLSALETTYVPLQVREDKPAKKTKVDRLGVYIPQTLSDCNDKLVSYARAIELGRVVGRDIGGADPERMAPPRVVDYVQEIFGKSSGIKINIIKDQNEIDKDFPLFAAVNRAARGIDRHQGRLIFLEYTGEGEINSTAMLVGKGVTYDTGGLDIKTGGGMTSMSYDKCGAASVAGFFKVLSELKPKQLKAIGVLAVARNSCGEEGYVTDEILKARAGVRIRVGNTDAEGRLVMADSLCYMKELALKEVNPQLFTIATLTGHAARTYGDNYTAVMDNGPAREKKVAQRLQELGESIGDPFEISTVRREDYEFIDDKSKVADILQCNTRPSNVTSRGHQYPAAFLARASGLDKHGRDSDKPLSYTHLDIAGSAGKLPGLPTARPIPALCQMFIADRVL
ncbi:unnamed protein product [Adineta ricciae]|uniref:RING-type E3 ubiquitin transferase n=1 Tax=Adineta ricciae TaxID=249248 RepID=A0A814IPU0_ADIRI|nr:unnamed protein product [Adineta ricciae]